MEYEEVLDMQIYLRPVTEADGRLIVRWRNTPNVMKHCFTKKVITPESNKSFYDEYIKTGKYLQYIVERIEEQSGAASYPIATCYLKDIDKDNKRCELCIFTSDDEEWNTESQSMAVKMLIEKAFNELKMHKIYSYVFYKYMDEAELLKRAGFKSEAILKEEAIDENGKYIDVVRLAIIKDEEKTN